MTPDDHRMIQDLFQRLASQGVDKDPQADRVIADAMRSNRDAGYMLVQTALVYEHQMEEQELRIRDLEDQIAQLQSRSAAPAAASGGGSFLGGRIGSNRGSVPPVAAPQSSPWQSAPQQPQYQQAPQQRGGYAPQQAPMAQGPAAQAPAAGGGGFLRSALQTAAGVAGGMMVANSLSGLFGGGNNAHAAGGDSGALRDADSTQDELQDAQLEADAEQDDTQDASYDSGGGFDDIET
ncbi:MAG: DUF2076 domain-containing protein [Hyphomicrobiaceae bacterium]